MVLKSINCLLANGKTTKIDIGFYNEFKKYNWYMDKGYVRTTIIKNGKKEKIFLHHLVLGFDPKTNKDKVVDHKYGNKSDNRFKKVRIVNRSINSTNRKPAKTNTGFPYIHFNYENNAYQVSYLENYTVSTSKGFCIDNTKPDDDVNAFFEAFEFNENIRTNTPIYRKAFNLDDNCSSSGDSIDEIDYENRINIDRLWTTNNSKYYNIFDRIEGSYWRVKYYDEMGKPHEKGFYYKPKSSDTKDEALIKGRSFQKEYDIFSPKNKNKIILSSKEMIINLNDEEGDMTQSYEDLKTDISLQEGMDIIETKNILSESDSDTIIMSEDEIKEWQLNGHLYLM